MYIVHLCLFIYLFIYYDYRTILQFTKIIMTLFINEGYKKDNT